MKIGVIGTWYVGLIQAVWMAKLWFKVIAADISKEKIDNLKNRIPVIYEDWLDQLLKETLPNIEFTTDISKLKWTDVIFVCVWTPQDETWKTDLKYIETVAKDLKKILNWEEIVVIKSTVPVWTNKKVYNLLWRKNPVVSNPEFLREGFAIYDFFNPDRIVLWFKKWERQEVIDKMKKIYNFFEDKGIEIIITDWQTAELIKYTANSFLATKISFINEIARLADKVGANVKTIAKAIWLDSRIWKKFLNAWIWYWWSCFPKDVKSLIHQFKDNWLTAEIISSVDRVNETQVDYFLNKILDKYKGNVKGKVFGVLWVAFKPNTDDLRESRGILIIKKLIDKWAKMKVFDYNSKALENFKKQFDKLMNNVIIANNFDDLVDDIDALIITIEDKRILNEDFSKLNLKDNIIFDWRNLFDRDQIKQLWFEYIWVWY